MSAQLPVHEFLALEALDQKSEPSEFYATFACIGFTANLTRTQTKRAVRRLAKRGYAEYRRGLWTEDGEPAGSGYAITEVGRAAFRAAMAAALKGS